MSNDAPRKADPIALARAGLTRHLPKRFYREVTVAARGSGHAVQLDGRPLRTPNKLVLILPTAPLAEAIAAEWAGQAEHIDPLSMPLTRLANSVRDQVEGREAAVRADIVKYAGSDLLCYRAPGPAGLVQAQAMAWDPVLNWARDALGADFAVCSGLMPVEQTAASRAAIEAAVAPLHSFRLASAHVMTTLLGSVILMLAALSGRLTAEEAWKAAHIDEDCQMAQWGVDAEAARRQESRKAEYLAAVRLRLLLGDPA
ncbi:MAG: ATP12 family chaperone protein [Hyphomicrobiaceae bacterium]